MIEGLSLLIAREKKEKRIIGLKVTCSLTLTHIFFVDDFLLSGDGSLLEWLHYKSLINLFCGFSGISISKRKSVFGSLNISEDVSLLISHEFSYPWKSLEVGFTYLGFFY